MQQTSRAAPRSIWLPAGATTRVRRACVLLQCRVASLVAGLPCRWDNAASATLHPLLLSTCAMPRSRCGAVGPRGHHRPLRPARLDRWAAAAAAAPPGPATNCWTFSGAFSAVHPAALCRMPAPAAAGTELPRRHPRPPCLPAALHYAARAGHTEVSGKLVIAGAHVAAADPHGITAAHLAAERGFAGAARQLRGASRPARAPLAVGARRFCPGAGASAVQVARRRCA